MSDKRQNPNFRRTVVPLVLILFGMAGLAWAAVPLYNLFCRVTGFAGTTQVAEAGADEVLDRTVLVRFDASLSRDMPWEFAPVQTSMEVRIGETVLAFFEAYNPTDRVIAGSATYNVSPFRVGGYFTKIDCFCFTQQVLEPGERAKMPVTFYIDPAIVEDEEARDVTAITLSYTFFETELDKHAALGQTTQ